MRPSSRKRVATWLLGLPVESGGRKECAHRGRLEMISFWLLCWKLLRATAGLRRTTPELTDGSHDGSSPSNSNPVDSSPNPAHPTETVAVAMSSTPLLQGTETDQLIGCSSQETERPQYPEGHGAWEPIADELEEVEREEEGEGEKDLNGVECGFLLMPQGVEKGRQTGRASKGTQDMRGGEEDEEEEEGTVKGNREQTDSYVSSSDGQLCPLAGQQKAAGSKPPAQTAVPAAMLDFRDDLSDCLKAELAIVSSDSDAGEDYLNVSQPCDITNQEGGSRGLSTLNSVYRGDGKEQEKEEVWVGKEHWRGEEREEDEEEEERKGERDEEADIFEQLEEKVMREDEEEEREHKAHIEMEDQSESERGAEMYAEDEEERRRDLFVRSPSESSIASSTDPDKKVPADFCVQETRGENINSEHVDFLLARQQWRKMEEEVKGWPIPKPGMTRQGSFRGTHSSLYPPTRSPRLKQKQKEVPQPCNRQPPFSSTLSPSSEDSGLDDSSSYRSQQEETETAVEREIRLTLEREERHRRERGMVTQGLTIPRPASLQTGRSPPRPPACRTPTLSISPSPSPSSSTSSSLPRPLYHEMTANNVIILEPDSSHNASRTRHLSPGGFSDRSAGLDSMSANIIVVETSNLIIRSASEFCLNSAPTSLVEPQQSTFSSNPFFKLRSLSSQSLVEQEIRVVRQREDEWRRQREEEWRKRRREEEWRRVQEKERYDTVLVSPGMNDNAIYTGEVPDKSASSPPSPSRNRRMERSSLSCDHKFPPALMVPQRQNAMAQRWEASLQANQKQD